MSRVFSDASAVLDETLSTTALQAGHAVRRGYTGVGLGGLIYVWGHWPTTNLRSEDPPLVVVRCKV